MKLIFLGTSSGWPLPRLGCNCPICSSLDIKDSRLRPSVLIDEQILIDAPIDIYHQFKKYKVNPNKITHILITHAHDDHIMGLHDLSHVYGKKNKISLVATRGTLFLMRKKVGKSMQAFKIIEAKPFEKLELLNNIYCWFIPVNHGNIDAFAIKIKAGKPIVYAPEFRKILPSARKELGDIELAIIDGSSKTRQGQARGHETIEEGIRFGKNIRAKKIIFTNIGHKTDTHQALTKFVKDLGGERFSIAFDGLEVKV